MSLLRVVIIIFLAFSTSSCASSKQRPDFEKLTDFAALSSARWGMAVRSLDTGNFIYRKEDTKAFMPASNMKLITTAVALIKLGPDFRYTTNLYSAGKVENGILHGDLVLRGSGDPTVSGRFSGGNATAVFEEWANALAGKGIKEITGSVVGDDTYFDDRRLGDGWSWDDEPYCYSAQISALSFNENCIGILIAPGASIGARAAITIYPETRYVTIINDVVTSAGETDSLSVSRTPGTNMIRIKGEVGIDSPAFHEAASIDNPALYSVTVLTEILASKGIKVSGPPRVVGPRHSRVPDYSSMQIATSYSSPPLSEIIKVVNKHSQNFYAEQLFRTIGKLFGGEGSTTQSAGVIRSELSDMGILSDSVSIRDGSGLSRLDAVSPHDMVILLDYVSRQEFFPYFYDSLPVAGTDGTLVKRMKKTDAEGRVRAKTGYYEQVGALSGYVTSKEGGKMAFSLMVEHYPAAASDVREFQDCVCTGLSNLPSLSKSTGQGRQSPLCSPAGKMPNDLLRH